MIPRCDDTWLPRPCQAHGGRVYTKVGIGRIGGGRVYPIRYTLSPRVYILPSSWW